MLGNFRIVDKTCVDWDFQIGSGDRGA